MTVYYRSLILWWRLMTVYYRSIDQQVLCVLDLVACVCIVVCYQHLIIMRLSSHPLLSAGFSQ